MTLTQSATKSFNPLPSHEGRLSSARIPPLLHSLSIHFPLTREDHIPEVGAVIMTLSIHFPLTREDFVHFHCLKLERNLSIHFPLTREDGILDCSTVVHDSFQSTSLSRGKTSYGSSLEKEMIFQSTSLSRGKTRFVIHPIFLVHFQSTSLSRGKTRLGTPSYS